MTNEGGGIVPDDIAPEFIKWNARRIVANAISIAAEWLQAQEVKAAPRSREVSEKELQAVLQKVLREHENDFADYVLRGEKVPKSAYASLSADLRRVLEAELRAQYISGALQTQTALDKIVPTAINWTKPNTNAQRWATRYTFDLVRGLQDTTIAQVQSNIAALERDLSAFFEKPTTLGDVRGKIAEYIPDWQDRLGRVWSSEERARMIATTEVTRASVEGDLASVEYLSDEYGIEMIPVWQTSNDEIVCDICGPLHNTQQGDGWEDPPPAHVNCRCAISFELAK